jgi:thiol:disulfide interchange protein DsbA
MSRRALPVLAAVFFLSAQAQPGAALDPIEIRPTQPTTDPDRIVVTAFFSYQCPHCNAFEPVLRRWAEELPDDVLFERVPVSIGRPSWVPIARAFYALDSIGALERFDAAIFHAIHVEGVRLYDRESVLAFFGSRGIDGEAFAAAYDSFGIDAFVRRADQTSNAHKVFSIPALSIDGKYMVPIADDGTFERQLAAVGGLIDRLRAAKQAH